MGNAVGCSEPSAPVELIADDSGKIVLDRPLGIGNPPPPAILDDVKAGVKAADDCLVFEEMTDHSKAPSGFSCKSRNVVSVQESGDLELADA